MEDLLNWLKKNDYIFNEYSVLRDKKDNSITHIYFEDDLLYYCAIAPHEGNNYHYILRVNNKKTFDRWSVCDAQYMYLDSWSIANELQENMEMIYKDVLTSVLEYEIDREE